jgi:hypothetical protein
MTAIKLNKLDWLVWAINHMKHERVHVCLWHETDMPTLFRNIRSQGQSRKHVLH